MDIGPLRFLFMAQRVLMVLKGKQVPLVQVDRLAQTVRREVLVVRLVLKVQQVLPDHKVKLVRKEYPVQQVQLV